MKNFYYTLLFFGFGLFASAQNIGGTPVEGIIPIKRMSINTETLTDTNSNTNPVARTTATAVQNYVPTSTEVGITEGQLSVSLSGAANYSIPIAVPPGINSVAPQVSLVYNSQGVNGLAGYGWNISGVSAITQIPRTKFHDGELGVVNLDANDRFALDGQRLIAKNGGVYGEDGTEYETENFSNLKITSFGVSPLGVNYGPASFLVQYPDGSVALYGYSTDSCSITTWGITYWENLQGVRISYTYNLTNNNLSIKAIKYGTAGTIDPINQIQFVYQQRERPEESYIGGKRILMDKILSEIKVWGNGLGFRNYVLDHEATSLGYERLKSITEKSGNGTKELNPTVFAYEDTEKLIKYTGITTDLEIDDYNEYENPKVVSGDFYGDEKMDFILPRNHGYNIYTDITKSTSNIGLTHNIRNYDEIFAINLLNSTGELMPKQGWTVAFKQIDTSQSSEPNPGYVFEVYAMGKSTNNPNNESQILYQYNKVVNFPLGYISYSNTYRDIPKELLTGDFNGDGLTDVIAIEKNFEKYNSSIYDYEYNFSNDDSKSVYFIDLRRDNTTNFLTYSGELVKKTLPNNDTKIEVADVNGDGKSDIMVFEDGSVTIYNLNIANQLEVLFTYVDSSIIVWYYNIIHSTTILVGDYNGDGKADFLNPGVGLFTSTGLSFSKSIKTFGNFVQGNSGSTPPRIYTPMDYNNDGKTDIVSTFTSASGSSIYLGIYVNKNNTFTEIEDYSTNIQTASSFGWFSAPIFLSDDHNGKKLEIAFLNSDKIYYFESLSDFSQEKLLRSVTTSNGVKESISYLPLTKNAVLSDAVDPSDPLSGSVYSPLLFTEKYPQRDIESEESIDVVAKIEKQSSTVHKKQFYSYSGATSNMEGLGFLGFRSVMQTNWVPATDTWQDYENSMISSVSIADPHLRGANVANYSYKGFFPVSKIEYIPKVNPPVSTNVTVNDTRTATETVVATNSIRFVPGARISPTVGNTFKTQITPDYDPNGYVETNSNPPIGLISKSLSFYESDLSPTKVFRLINTQSNSYNILDNTSSETRSVYDDYNSPLESTSKIKNAGVVEQSTTTKVVYDDQPNGTTYYIGRPTSKTQTVTVTGDITTSKELYEYTNHLVTKVKKKANNSDYSIEDNEYDAFGNITKKTITVPAVVPNPAPAPRITNYEYNPESPYNGRFLTKSIDVQGLAT